MFVGEVDYDGCDFYYIIFVLLFVFKLNFFGKIKKVRLNYVIYEKCIEIYKIFDFYNGDVVIIVDWNDYLNDRELEKVCIERVNLRLVEERYLMFGSSSESFVNWIFLNVNILE